MALTSVNLQKASNGHVYACVLVSEHHPGDDNIHEIMHTFQEITDLDIPSINIIVDFRTAPILQYLPHLPYILNVLHKARTPKINSTEIWLNSTMSYLELIVRPIINAVFTSEQLLVRYI
jgi:hypothetical protein